MSPNTKLLIDFERAIEDVSGNHMALTNVGVTINPSFVKYGVGAGYFNGSAYLTPTEPSLCNGAGDWTVDWWEYRTAAVNNSGTISRNSNAGGYSGLLFGYVTSSRMIQFYASNNGTTWNVVNGLTMGTATLNQWIHRCVVKHSNTYYAFENGELRGSATSTEAFSYTAPLNIGYYAGGGFKGYMDNVRVSDKALWTASFIPPAAADYAAFPLYIRDGSWRQASRAYVKRGAAWSEIPESDLGRYFSAGMKCKIIRR